MSTPLATLFTKIGFDIDTKSIAALDASLARLESKLKGLSSSLQGISDNKTLNAAARLANAQARKMNAEVGLQRQQASIAKTQAEVEKLRQRSVIGEQALLKKRVDTEGFVAKAKASSEKLRENTANKLAAAQLRATPYAQRPTRPANDKSFNGIGGVGLNYQAAIGAVATGGFMQSAFKMANFAASQPVQYEFITGSKEKAGEQIKYVNDLTDKLKLDLVETDTAYKQFLGATDSTIGEAKTQEIFTGVQKLGVMMGASSDQMKRGSKAIIQMLSKQKLSAEELTGQMAEAMLIPGATQVFADVLEGKNGMRGSGDVKALFANMQKGKYTLQDIVKVLESLDDRIDPAQLEKALSTPAAELRKLTTTWQRSLIELNNAGFFEVMVEGLKGVTKLVIKATNWITENKAEIKEWSVIAIKSFKWLIDNLPLIVSYFAALRIGGWVTSMSQAAASATSLGAALSKVLIRLVLVPALVALAALAFIELYDTLSGQDTLWTRLSEQKDKGILGWIAAITRSAFEALSLLGKLAVAQVEGSKGFAQESRDNFMNALLKMGFITEAELKQYQEHTNKRIEGERLKTLTQPLGGIGAGLGYAMANMNPLASEEEKKQAWLDYYIPRGGKMGELTPKTTTTTINAPITMTFANGDPTVIEKAMDDIMGKWATKAAANTPAFSLLKQ